MTNPKFTYKEKVILSQGFYRGKKGVVLSYEDKNNVYEVVVKLDRDTEEKIKVNETQLKKDRTPFPFNLL